MPKHLYVLFFITFILGCVAGVVILLQTKTGVFAGDENPSAETGFSVGVRMYGGCMRVGCPSYYINPEGEYTYIVRSVGVQTDGFKKGVLPSKAYTSLESLAETTNFGAIAQTVFTGECPSTYDGAAYTFEVDYDGIQYTLDSCTQQLEGKELFDRLIEYFRIFETDLDESNV